MKMFCFSSPQPRLNNRRAINYIPNWIPICPFAMYGSKTFYLLSPFKVPQDPSVLRKNIYFCPSCNSYLPSTEFQLSSNSRWVGLKINFMIVFFFQPLMLTVDKELSRGKFKLNVFKSDYLSTECIVYLFRFWKCFINRCFFFHVPHSWHQRFKVTFRLNGKALGLVSLFNTFYYIHPKVRLRAVSYFSFESQWTGIAQSTREGRGTRVITD